MKNLLLILSIVFCFIKLSAQDTTKVLFIGNSITYFNNMPQTFEVIANDKGNPTDVTLYAPGGTGFINHVGDQNVYHLFQEGHWDYVVLQPGSNESPGYSETIEQTTIRAKTLKDSILFYSPCAKVLFYEISYGVWGNSALDLTSYNNTMDLIRNNLEILADSTSSFFAPAGEVIRKAWNTDQNTLLWGSYGDIHPNAKGSYIIACAFYATIFNDACFGTNVVNNLTSAEANYYQNLADSTILNHTSNWRIDTTIQRTNFDYTQNDSEILFSSTSENFDSLAWNFGDGNTSTDSIFTNTYLEAGSYTISLTTYKENCSQIKTATIIIEEEDLGLSIYDLKSETTFYPNPIRANEQFHFNSNENIENIKLYSILGKELNTPNLINGNLPQNLNKGTYLIKFYFNNNHVLTRKIVVY